MRFSIIPSKLGANRDIPGYIVLDATLPHPIGYFGACAGFTLADAKKRARALAAKRRRAAKRAA